MKKFNSQSFTQELNSLRLSNKNKWFTLEADVDGKNVVVKCFGTWLQIFRIDGIDHAGPMDMKVTQWKKYVQDSIEKHPFAA